MLRANTFKSLPVLKMSSRVVFHLIWTHCFDLKTFYFPTLLYKPRIITQNTLNSACFTVRVLRSNNSRVPQFTGLLSTVQKYWKVSVFSAGLPRACRVEECTHQRVAQWLLKQRRPYGAWSPVVHPQTAVMWCHGGGGELLNCDLHWVNMQLKYLQQNLTLYYIHWC